MKETSVELKENVTESLTKSTQQEVKNEKKSDEKEKREGGKPKSPFTVVSRNAVQDCTKESLGDSIPEKDKNI